MHNVYLFVQPFLNTFLDKAVIIFRHKYSIMKYAFAYLRVSTEEQTVQNQKIALERWAKLNDYLILDYFEDPAISGKVPATQRPAFREMIELVKVSGVDAVLVYELSRVGRTFWDTLDAIKAVEHYASLISCSPRESFLQTTETSIRKLMIGILTWAAERERELLVQRTKDGMHRAREAGKGIGRPQKSVDKNKLITLLAENHSKTRIARTLGVSKATLYKKLRELS
jgi:putative DNA-invertase from lambdoid prophage Rac